MKRFDKIMAELEESCRENSEYIAKFKKIEHRVLHKPLDVPDNYFEAEYKKFTNLQKARCVLSSLIRIEADLELVGVSGVSEEELDSRRDFRKGMLALLGAKRGDLPAGVCISRSENIKIGKLLKAQQEKDL